MALSLRRFIFGSPFETEQAHHTRLPNYLALPVFASDALSSVSYATEEILLVLATVSVSGAALGVSWPIGIAIAVLLAVVATSYRQTIAAYPQGGGAYRVSRDNLGLIPGLTAAASLLIDYVLTVAVSISAGVAAITSAFPELHQYTVGIAVGCVIFVGMANLRGAKESGVLFAVPTYAFLASMAVLIVVGLVRLMMGHDLQPPNPPANAWDAAGAAPLGLYVILRAFSSGCTALTGVEAVTDGVPAFRPPEAKNAQKVLFILGVLLITIFLGVTWLSHALHVVPWPAETEGEGELHRYTVVAQIAYAVFGKSWFFYIIQSSTALILILAANTAFVDFPRLSMFLAKDRLLPRQLANVGDRLVYSNGIIGLTVLSILTVVAFSASTHHLIPLYALGVFLSFTLSQSGMVVRWLRLKPAGWQLGAAVNGIGAIVTAIVLVVIAITKFTAGDPINFFPLTTPLGLWAVFTAITFVLLSMYHRWMGKGFLGVSTALFFGAWAINRFELLGKLEIHLGAWLVMAAIPAIVWMCFRINAHYQEVAKHLTMEKFDEFPEFRHTVLLLVPGVHRGLMPAIQYARTIGGDVRGVYVEIEPEKTAESLKRWASRVPDIPLVVLESPYRGLIEPILRYIDEVEKEREDDIVTVILPEFVTEKWWTKLLHNQSGLVLKWALLFKKGVVVTNIRYHLEECLIGGAEHPLAAAAPETAEETL